MSNPTIISGAAAGISQAVVGCVNGWLEYKGQPKLPELLSSSAGTLIGLAVGAVWQLAGWYFKSKGVDNPLTDEDESKTPGTATPAKPTT